MDVSLFSAGFSPRTVLFSFLAESFADIELAAGVFGAKQHGGGRRSRASTRVAVARNIFNRIKGQTPFNPKSAANNR